MCRVLPGPTKGASLCRRCTVRHSIGRVPQAVCVAWNVHLLLLFAGLNIPVTEVSYENQRYYPWPVKWSSKLLPTDRKPWSDEQGLCEESRWGAGHLCRQHAALAARL